MTLNPNGDGSATGSICKTQCNATGAGISNYGPITYIDGTLIVKSTPTATIWNFGSLS